jgi:formate C-acetyltransferase
MKRTTKERGPAIVAPKAASQSPKASTPKVSAKASSKPSNDGPAQATTKVQAADSKAPAKPSKPSSTDAWRGFKPGLWQRDVNVRWFIQQNYTPYDGDGSFLAPATERTKSIWKKLEELFVQERKKGVLDISMIPSSITAHPPGYIDREKEVIVGLQTDAPLKRAIMPKGGLRMVLNSFKAYGYEAEPSLMDIFTKYRKTHNDGVFDAYTADIRACRSSHILTGLPDAYGRGRIIGDYRRVALYGVARLRQQKEQEKAALDLEMSTENIIRDREELCEQFRALQELEEMAKSYGFDISGPARNAREAVQWLYFGYLAAVKEQNGAAMSLGRTSTFLDIYFERDLKEGTLTESQVQEIVDDFVIKLRIVRFLRTPEYDDLFAGDPTWVTESIGGMGDDGRPLVTKTSFRFLQTLYNMGPAPEPNLTVLYSPRLPDNFKSFAAKVAIDSSSLQFESDNLIRAAWGDDGAIACCVSPMLAGKQMQFFGARANLAKCLLYAINGGRDELTGKQIGPKVEPVKADFLEFEDVVGKFERMMDWLAGVYVNAMNVIHYMHDKYAYERIEMALHDYAPVRTMAFGIAGLSVVADSLSAIRYAKVKVERDDTGLIVDYHSEGDFPKFGNNDNRVDQMAATVVSTFMSKLRKHPTYRNAVHTQSVLTITSNVVYGKNTGHTPDGRRKGEPFAPGANPMHGRDTHGIMAAGASVAKIPYRDAADGISLTASMVPQGLGRTPQEQIVNLAGLMDAFFGATGYHANVNVLNRETLLDAMDHPEKYPQLTIRVSGYAVNFVRLTREQQMDVINRTFHGKF